jgi:hypothetical protein
MIRGKIFKYENAGTDGVGVGADIAIEFSNLAVIW